MKFYKGLAVIAAVAPLYFGCAQQQPKLIEENVEVQSEIKPREESPFVYERRDKHLQKTLFGNLGNGVQGRLLLYDDGKRELDITSKLGSITATDFNNDGSYDLIEGKGDLRRYSNDYDSFLNWAAETIFVQNR